MGEKTGPVAPRPHARPAAAVLAGPLLLLALGLLGAGLFLPALAVRRFFVTDSFSIVDGVLAFAGRGDWFLFAVVGLFSVVVPLLKIALSLWAWHELPRRPPLARRLVGWLSALAKWSMLDVFVIAITVLVIDGSLVDSADVGPGVVLFAAAVLTSAVALGLLRRAASAPPG